MLLRRAALSFSWRPGPGPGRSGRRPTASSPWIWAQRRCLAPALGGGGRAQLAGLAISVGNPHVACMIDQPVADVDLSGPQVLAPPALTGGANVEVVRVTGPREVEMRVHERGSGLTLSCGTGAVRGCRLRPPRLPASGRTARAGHGLCRYPAED